MQEAQQHVSVEAWFHNLIRQNFMGALKVRLLGCDLMYPSGVVEKQS
jgi:hypothetical protein